MSIPSNKEKYVAQAQKLVEKGQYDRAIREYLKVIAEDASDIRTWIRIGDLYVKLGQKGEAVEHYRKVAQLYTQQSELEKAAAVYKQIIAISPTTLDAYMSLGLLYRSLSRPDQAIEMLEQAADLYARQGKTRESLAAEQALVDSRPDSVARRIRLAELYSKHDLIPDAVREFEMAAAKLHALGRSEEYARVAERLLHHAPEQLDVLKRLARFYLNQQDGQRALLRLQQGFRVSSKDPELLELLADAFVLLGNMDKSIAVLKELARLHAARGVAGLSIGVYQRVLQLSPDDPEARRALTQTPTAGPGPEPSTGRLSSLILSEGSQDPAFAGVSPLALGAFSAMSGSIKTPGSSRMSMQFTPAAGTQMAGPANTEEDAARVVAEAESFLRFGLAKRALEHLQAALQRNADLKAVRERLVKLHESQREYKSAITELRILLGQASDIQEEVRFLREILRLDDRDQVAEKRLKTITGTHTVEEFVSADLLEVPEIVIGSAEGDPDSPWEVSDPVTSKVPVADYREIVASRRSSPEQSAITPATNFSATDEVPIAAFQAYVEKMRAEGETEGLPVLGKKASAAPPTPVVPAAPPSPQSTGPSSEVALQDDLNEVEFFLKQRLFGEARRSLERLRLRHPESKTVQAKWTRLQDLEKRGVYTDEVVIDVDMADVREEVILPPVGSAPGLPPEFLRAAAAPSSVPPPNSPLRRTLPPPPPRPSRMMHTISPIAPPMLSPEELPRAISSQPPPRVPGRTHPSEISGAFRLGVSLRNRGQHEQAISEFERCLNDERKGGRAALMIGLCHRDRNQIRQAIESFKLGVHIPGVSDQDLCELYYQLGRSYELLLDAKEAIHFYQNVLQRDGRFRDAADRINQLQKSSPAR